MISTFFEIFDFSTFDDGSFLDVIASFNSVNDATVSAVAGTFWPFTSAVFSPFSIAVCT